jgi:hypothetical protein
MMRDPDRLIDEAERLARQAFDDIDEVLPEVLLMVGAIDYESGRSLALFEPIDRETFRVAGGFLRGPSTSVAWHSQSEFAARPDGEAFSVAIALLALTEDSVLRLVDAIPIFTKWRDGFYLNRPAAGR